MSKFERKTARKLAKHAAKSIPLDFRNANGSFDIPLELRNLFPPVMICFGEEDENGDPLKYDIMSLSDEEFNSKLHNIGKESK
jgi:hypothetical protein